MTQTLSAKEHPLSKIFSDDYSFFIPGYQRPYSWGTDQARELLDDLLVHMDSGKGGSEQSAPYFLGSIVLIKKETSPESTVVDGQQRLTTLTLLLSAIRQVVADGVVRGDITRLIYEHGNSLTGMSERYRLSLRDRDSEFFKKYVQHEQGISALIALNQKLSDAQNLIRANAGLYIERLSKLSQDRLIQFARFIATRCYLVAVATPDLDSAFRIFGVLNSRGLDLSATDILKAEILGTIASEQRERYTAQWENIEEDLGRDGFGELFGHIRTVYRKAKSQGTLLKEFREHVGPKDPAAFVDGVLKPMAHAFQEIADASYESTKNVERINALLEWLNRVEFKDWVPPTLAFFVRYRNDAEAILAYLTDLERLVYSMLVRRSGVNDRIDRFSRITVAIEEGGDLGAESSPLQLTPTEQYLTYEALAGPLYETHGARALALILSRLDDLLSDGSASFKYNVLSVEHVLPQQPGTDSEWATWIPNPQDRLYWVHRLANLVLLSRKKNSAASNFEFQKKKSAYFTRGGVAPFAMTTQLLGEETWTLEALKARQERLLAVVEKHWRLEGREHPQSSALRAQVQSDSDDLFVLETRKDGVLATARLVGDELVVLAGSSARPWASTFESYHPLREDLIASGELVPFDDDGLKFARDVRFGSPSAASAVVLGRPDNGRTSWVSVVTGKTFGETFGDPSLREESAEVGAEGRKTRRVEILTDFWTGFLERARERGELFARNTPSGKPWISTGMGRRGIGLAIVVNRSESRVLIHIELPNDDGTLAQAAFDSLHAHKDEIEARFGGPLEWQRNSEKRRSRILVEFARGSDTPTSEWPEFQELLIDTAVRMKAAFAVPVQALN